MQEEHSVTEDQSAERAIKDAENTFPQDMEGNHHIIDTGHYDPTSPEFDIVIDTRYYDPSSPEFDIEAYRKAIENARRMEAVTKRIKGGFEAIQKQMQETLMDAIKGTAPAMAQINMANKAEALRDTATAIVLTAQYGLKVLSDLVNSDTYKAIKESMAAIYSVIEQHSAKIEALSDLAAEIQDLAPFLSIELEEARKDPAFANYTLQDLLEQGFDADGNPTDSPFRQMIERAKQRQADFEAAEEAIAAAEQAEKELLRIQYNKTIDLKTATGKFSKVFFSLAAPPPKGEIDGQRQFTTLRYEGSKSKKEISLFYDYTWHEETLKKYGLDKKFDDFDFFVSSILDNQLAAGNNQISFTKLYKEMGGRDNPTGKQLEPLYHSLIKGLSTMMYMDDYEVMEAYNKHPDGKYHEIITPVMPVIIGNERYIANGKLANGYVKILDYSPFWRVSEPIGQITSWEKEILKL